VHFSLAQMEHYVVKLSAKLFWGLEVNVLEEEVYGLSKEEQSNLVTLKAKSKLKMILGNYGLEVLIEEVDKLKLHLHKLLCRNEINYACDHCHEYP